MRTAVRTIRLTHPLCDQIDKEAERRKISSAHVVRLALVEYFQRKQFESAFTAIEHRLRERIDLNSNYLAEGIKEVLDQLQPSQEVKS